MESLGIDNILAGFTLLMHFDHLLWMALGIFAGLMVGAIPGFNDTNFLAMMLPFSVYLGPMDAVVFMMACFCSSQAAGSFPAILLNIPGTPSNAPTCIEGFKLTRKGKAGQALGASIVSSTVGGLLSAVFALILTPIVGIYALKFGPAELFMMAVFGMTAVGSLTGKSTVKGLFSSALAFLWPAWAQNFNRDTPGQALGSMNYTRGFP